MNMVITDEGKIKFLTLCMLPVTSPLLEDYFVDLFVNNETVADDSVIGDFTIATFAGYAQVSVPRSDFVSVTIVAHVATTNNVTPPTFSCTGGSAQTAYGWIMTGQTSGATYAGQNFDTPRVMGPGSTESLDPFDFKLKTFA